MKRFLFLILFIASCLPVYSSELDGKAYLKKGKYELDKAKYEDAGSLSRMAYSELSSDDITTEEMVKRASNLIANYGVRLAAMHLALCSLSNLHLTS